MVQYRQRLATETAVAIASSCTRVSAEEPKVTLWLSSWTAAIAPGLMDITLITFGTGTSSSRIHGIVVPSTTGWAHYLAKACVIP